MSAMTIEHGTYKGYQAHRRRGATPCDECRAANAAYIKERRAENPALMEWQVMNAEARRKALARLAEMHPAQFAALLDQERDNAKRKRWPRRSR